MRRRGAASKPTARRPLRRAGGWGTVTRKPSRPPAVRGTAVGQATGARGRSSCGAVTSNGISRRSSTVGWGAAAVPCCGGTWRCAAHCQARVERLAAVRARHAAPFPCPGAAGLGLGRAGARPGRQPAVPSAAGRLLAPRRVMPARPGALGPTRSRSRPADLGPSAGRPAPAPGRGTARRGCRRAAGGDGAGRGLPARSREPGHGPGQRRRSRPISAYPRCQRRPALRSGDARADRPNGCPNELGGRWRCRRYPKATSWSAPVGRRSPGGAPVR